jgi:hypothetical protein
MNTLDLDQLRDSWGAQSRAVDARLELDLHAVRRTLAARTRRALGRHERGLLLQLLSGAAGLAALAAFLWRHGGELASVLAALPLVGLLLAHAVMDLRQWRDLRRLDFHAPLLNLRADLDRILARRLRLVRLVVYLSPLLWWLLALVALKGFWNIDLMDYLHPSVLAVTAVAGVALIGVVALTTRQVARRWADSPERRLFLADLAGSGWRRASEELENQLRFEQDLQTGGAAQALRDNELALPEEREAERHALGRRVALDIGLVSLLILLSGGFNAAHGGQFSALLPGIILHLCGIGWLIGAIRHRLALVRPQAGTPLWHAQLVSAVRARTLLLQSFVIAAPLLLAALVQVLGLALARIDIVQALGYALSLGLGLAAAALSALLWRRRQRDKASFAAALTEALSLRTLRRSHRLAQWPQAQDEAPRRAA